jgi:hypothetical protein
MMKRVLFGRGGDWPGGVRGLRILLHCAEERTMGAIQKIFYFHASTAWAGETTFFVCFLANLLYIWKRSHDSTGWASPCAEVGVACITGGANYRAHLGQAGLGHLVDVGRAADIHICALDFVHLLSAVAHARRMIRSPCPAERALRRLRLHRCTHRFCAIRWWRTQHPAPVIMGGPDSGLEPTMKAVFFFNVAVMHVFAAFLIMEAVFAGEEQARRGTFAARIGGPVKNLNSIFAAYMIGWGVFFSVFCEHCEAHQRSARGSRTLEKDRVQGEVGCRRSTLRFAKTMMKKRVGIVLFQLGGPDSLDAVEPFLRNLFVDPDIIPMGPLAFLRGPLARYIARKRSVGVRGRYAMIGRRSPIALLTERQRMKLSLALSPYVDSIVVTRCVTGSRSPPTLLPRLKQRDLWTTWCSCRCIHTTPTQRR